MDDLWRSRKVSRRNLGIVIGLYSLGVMMINLAFDDDGVSSAVRPASLIMIVLSAVFFILEQKLSRFAVSENCLQLVFNLLVGALTLVTISYFLIIVVDIVYFGSSLTGTTDASSRGRMLGGSVPPLLKMVATLPLQAIPAGMDITVAKRLTSATVAMSLLVVYFMCQIPLASDMDTCSCETSDADLRLKVTMQDVLNLLLCISIAYFTLAPGLQMTEELTKTFRDGRLADSVLNHILKNSIAGAACLLEIEIEETPKSSDRLTQALEQLHRCMDWCMSRQVMLDLLADSYKSFFSPCHVRRFLERMVRASAGQGSFAAVVASLAIEQAGALVQLDVHMAEIVVANALSNAAAHGDTDEAIEVSARFHTDTTGENIVVLKVENYIAKGVEEGQLTNVVLEKIRTDAMSRNKSAPRTSDPIAKRTTTKRSTHSISTNSGLYHIHLACQGAAGSFDLHLGSRNGRNTVILEAFLPARQDAFSKVGKAASHNDNHAAVPDSVPLENSLQEFIPEGLKICVIDDSKILCKGYKRLVLPKLKADKDLSCVVCPISSSCIDRFMDESMGTGSRLDDKQNRPADIVILDQNIDVTSNVGVQICHELGTKLAIDLRSRNFKGLILIRSANSTEADVAGYLQTGAVDSCLGKDQGNGKLVASIGSAFHHKQAKNAPPLDLQMLQQTPSPSSPIGRLLAEDQNISSSVFAAGDSYNLGF